MLQHLLGESLGYCEVTHRASHSPQMSIMESEELHVVSSCIVLYCLDFSSGYDPAD